MCAASTNNGGSAIRTCTIGVLVGVNARFVGARVSMRAANPATAKQLTCQLQPTNTSSMEQLRLWDHRKAAGSPTTIGVDRSFPHSPLLTSTFPTPHPLMFTPHYRSISLLPPTHCGSCSSPPLSDPNPSATVPSTMILTLQLEAKSLDFAMHDTLLSKAYGSPSDTHPASRGLAPVRRSPEAIPKKAKRRLSEGYRAKMAPMANLRGKEGEKKNERGREEGKERADRGSQREG
ncbi:hypothetical protein B9Z19DRAFT_1067129 [Tuber borchii]|uniref:Uncharacterized protein n=1 Tax=Tuber borchii TaxID=42251 RepID=A0A2T6ZK26_TUBBO|nr:hypothetical protein B9Z19DRAFT_1067129 [Tuber borchii]